MGGMPGGNQGMPMGGMNQMMPGYFPPMGMDPNAMYGMGGMGMGMPNQGGKYIKKN